MTEFTEHIWFKVLWVLIAIFFIIFTAVNIGYFNKLRTCSQSCLSSTEVTSMIALNVVLLIIAIIFLLIGLWRLFVPSKIRKTVVRETKGALTRTDLGYVPTYRESTVVEMPTKEVKTTTVTKTATPRRKLFETEE